MPSVFSALTIRTPFRRISADCLFLSLRNASNKRARSARISTVSIARRTTCSARNFYSMLVEVFTIRITFSYEKKREHRVSVSSFLSDLTLLTIVKESNSPMCHWRRRSVGRDIVQRPSQSRQEPSSMLLWRTTKREEAKQLERRKELDEEILRNRVAVVEHQRETQRDERSPVLLRLNRRYERVDTLTSADISDVEWTFHSSECWHQAVLDESPRKNLSRSTTLFFVALK